jgi:hypothetical protein
MKAYIIADGALAIEDGQPYEWCCSPIITNKLKNVKMYLTVMY